MLVAVLAVVLNRALPAASPLLIAIVLGALLTNIWTIPESWSAGITFASKKLLRVGIVLLGLQLAVGDILSLGWRVIVGVILVVTLSILGTLAMARALGISRPLSILIACGFSICGAAAVAGVEDIADADEEEVATAIALVVLFGTLMIPLAPLAAHAMGMGESAGGTWIGASTHEVAQVVAAAGAYGASALSVAVIVKLTRVVLLAPVAVALSLAARSRGTLREGTKRPPIVPLFVVGFLVMVGLGSLHIMPPAGARGSQALADRAPRGGDVRAWARGENQGVDQRRREARSPRCHEHRLDCPAGARHGCVLGSDGRVASVGTAPPHPVFSTRVGEDETEQFRRARLFLARARK